MCSIFFLCSRVGIKMASGEWMFILSTFAISDSTTREKSGMKESSAVIYRKEIGEKIEKKEKKQESRKRFKKDKKKRQIIEKNKQEKRKKRQEKKDE